MKCRVTHREPISTEKVRDPKFQENEFFDPRDVVQVKYEMLRRVSIEKAPVFATEEYGVTRPRTIRARPTSTRAVSLDGQYTCVTLEKCRATGLGSILISASCGSARPSRKSDPTSLASACPSLPSSSSKHRLFRWDSFPERVRRPYLYLASSPEPGWTVYIDGQS